MLTLLEESQFCGECGANLISGEAPVGTELPMVRAGKAIRLGFSNYFTFSGRATRAEYWWWMLFTTLFGLIPFASLVVLIPSLAVSVRRLHDINRSGWWLLLLSGLPVIVSMVLGFQFFIYLLMIDWIVLIVATCLRGHDGSNKYGRDPRRAPYPYQQRFRGRPTY